MLISEFARATGLTPDTVRYYVRRNLLRPEIGAKGGRNPYQLFGAADLRTAELIRLGQALGLSLAEIGRLLADEQAGRIDRAKSLAILSEQRARLARKVAELSALIQYVDGKIEWIQSGSAGTPPQLSDFIGNPD
jgi:DNA-binding transcriptional MerR regulator